MHRFRLLVGCVSVMIATTLDVKAQSGKMVSITIDGSYTDVNLGGRFKFGLRNPPIPIKRSNGQYDTLYDNGEGNMDMTNTRSSGFHIGLRASHRINDQFAFSAAIGLLHVTTKWDQQLGVLPIVDSSNGTVNFITPAEYHASISIDQINFCPSIRFLPFGSHFYLDGGVGMGVFVRQNTTSSRHVNLPTAYWPIDTLPVYATSNNVDDKRVQWTALLGTGFDIWIANDFSLDAGLHWRLSLNPLQSNGNQYYSYAFDVSLGLTYRVW